MDYVEFSVEIRAEDDFTGQFFDDPNKFFEKHFLDVAYKKWYQSLQKIEKDKLVKDGFSISDLDSYDTSEFHKKLPKQLRDDAIKVAK